MRKMFDETAKKFNHFLYFVNLIQKNKKSFNGDFYLHDLRYEVNSIYVNKDYLDHTFRPLGIILYKEFIETLNEEFKELFDDSKLFCQFLFEKDSVFELAVSYQGTLDHEKTVKNIWKAIGDYEIFLSNYKSLTAIVPKFKESLKILENVPKDDRHKFFDLLPIWSEPSTISYEIDEDAQLAVKLDQSKIFYGFRDFARIFLCDFCNGYFLAKRTDAKYCSIQCGDAYRQREWLKIPENRQSQLEQKREHYHNVYKEQQKENYNLRMIKRTKFLKK